MVDIGLGTNKRRRDIGSIVSVKVPSGQDSEEEIAIEGKLEYGILRTNSDDPLGKERSFVRYPTTHTGEGIRFYVKETTKEGETRYHPVEMEKEGVKLLTQPKRKYQKLQ